MHFYKRVCPSVCPSVRPERFFKKHRNPPIKMLMAHRVARMGLLYLHTTSNCRCNKFPFKTIPCPKHFLNQNKSFVRMDFQTKINEYIENTSDTSSSVWIWFGKKDKDVFCQIKLSYLKIILQIYKVTPVTWYVTSALSKNNATHGF